MSYIYDKLTPGQQTMFPKLAPRGILIADIDNTVNDHAGNERTRVDALELAIRMVSGEDDYVLNKLFCSHHKIGLLAQECQKADEIWMRSKLGLERDPNELSGSNILDMVSLQLAHLFEHHVGAYVFGDGVKNFPTWFSATYPGRALMRMDRMVGNRHGIFCKNAMIEYYMLPFYLRWVYYVQTHRDAANMLHVRLRPKLVTLEIVAGTHTPHIHTLPHACVSVFSFSFTPTLTRQLACNQDSERAEYTITPFTTRSSSLLSQRSACLHMCQW
jgi:hypothetical protein